MTAGQPETTAKPAKAGRDAGFTLLEALAALSLLALSAALLPGALQLGLRAMHTNEPLARDSAESPARAFLTARLAAAEPVFRRARDGALALDFSGSPGEITFLAPAPLASRDQGLVRYRIFIDEPSGSVRVAVRRASGDDAELLQDSVLFADAAGFAVRYFGRRAADDAARWHSEWTNEHALPRLVELTVTNSGHRGALSRATLPLVVPLRLARAD